MILNLVIIKETNKQKLDYTRNYYQRNKQKKLEYSNNYYHNNKDLIKERRDNLPQEKKDHIKNCQKQWRGNNIDYYITYYHYFVKQQI